MIKNFRNMKKADSKLLSIWWFAVLIIIGTGVIVGSFIFYSNKVDVRLIEADLITAKIIECMSEGGHINQDYMAGKLDIFEKCSFDKNVIESGSYFIRVGIYDNKGELIKDSEKYFGDVTLEKDCLIGSSMINAVNYPRCIERRAKLLVEGGEEAELRVYAGSNYEYKPETE